MILRLFQKSSEKNEEKSEEERITARNSSQKKLNPFQKVASENKSGGFGGLSITKNSSGE